MRQIKGEKGLGASSASCDVEQRLQRTRLFAGHGREEIYLPFFQEFTRLFNDGDAFFFKDGEGCASSTPTQEGRW